jgi:hypothetical protein
MRAVCRTLLLLGCLFTAPAIHAKVFTFDQLDIQCEVPDTWTFGHRTNVLVDVTDFTGQKNFILWSARSGPSDDLNSSRYRLRFEQTFIARGFNVEKREMILLHQVPFYRLTMTKDLGNKMLHTTAYLGITNPYAYGINLGEYNTDPNGDPDLQKIVDSITFPRPPILPSHNPFVRLFTPADGLPHDAAYLFGYRLAIILILLFFLSIPIIVLAGIGVGIYFLARPQPAPRSRD